MSAAIMRNNESVEGTTVGNIKPLHRFIRGQPKTVGIVVLILGSSFFIVSLGVFPDVMFEGSWLVYPLIILGVLFMICGTLYILTEHNTTKKRVTSSLALSVVTVIVDVYVILSLIAKISCRSYAIDQDYEFMEEQHNVTHEHHWNSHEVMSLSLELIFMVYLIVGVIIFITMSSLAVSALKSTKSQTIVVMTATPSETPRESGVQ